MQRLSLEELNDVVTTAVGAYTRRVFWARRPDVIDDLKQEAWATIFKAQQTFDPRVGVTFYAYAYRAVLLSLRRVLWMISSPASASHNKLRELAKAHHDALPSDEPATGQHHDGGYWDKNVAHAATHVDWDGPSALDQGNWADKLIEDQEWREEARMALEDIAGESEKLALGVDSLLSDEKPNEYAARVGVDPKRVHKARTKAKERITLDPDLYELVKERKS